MNADGQDFKYKELLDSYLILALNQNLNVRHLIIRENSYLPAIALAQARQAGLRVSAKICVLINLKIECAM